jgi:hypothetical protein
MLTRRSRPPLTSVQFWPADSAQFTGAAYISSQIAAERRVLMVEQPADSKLMLSDL